MKFDPQNIGKESVKNASKKKSSLWIIHERVKRCWWYLRQKVSRNEIITWNILWCSSRAPILFFFVFPSRFSLNSTPCVCLFIATWSDFSWELDEERVTSSSSSFNLLCLVMQVSPLEKSMDVYFCSYWKFLDDFLLFEFKKTKKKLLVLMAK